jgi:molybdenum cofactor biosynthesis protein B
MGASEHRTQSPRSVCCLVVTVSDTRTPDTDTSGRAIEALLREHGHQVSGRHLVTDDPPEVRLAIEAALGQPEVEAVITTGGTGISRRDGTVEVVGGLLEKRIDGFGELFRMLSFQDVGAAAMLSRACAGTARGKILIALPGSEAAVRLAMTRLVIPELGHLVREARR